MADLIRIDIVSMFGNKYIRKTDKNRLIPAVSWFCGFQGETPQWLPYFNDKLCAMGRIEAEKAYDIIMGEC